MTSLRTFQNEIDEIHTREVTKQRTRASSQSKTQDGVVPQSLDEASNAGVGLSEVEEEIQVRPRDLSLCGLADCSWKTLLLSGRAPVHDRARDLIASLLTHHRGEYIFRIGSQPPHAELYAGAALEGSEGWTGVSRTEQEVEKLCQEITATVEEVGGKVLPFPFDIASCIEPILPHTDICLISDTE
jgi:hypothetical protein